MLQLHVVLVSDFQQRTTRALYSMLITVQTVDVNLDYVASGDDYRIVGSGSHPAQPEQTLESIVADDDDSGLLICQSLANSSTPFK